jgi:hypothetical protein
MRQSGETLPGSICPTRTAVLVDGRERGSKLLQGISVAHQAVLVHRRQRIHQLVRALAVRILLEPQGDVLVVLVELHDARPIPLVETLRPLPGGNASLDGLLEGGHGDVPDPRKTAWSPRFRDLAEVAFPRGAVVISAASRQAQGAYGKAKEPRAATRQGLVQRILHVDIRLRSGSRLP